MLPIFLLSAAAVALDLASLLSTGRSAALGGLTLARSSVSKADVPGALAVVAQKSNAFIRNTFDAVKANTGTSVACSAISVVGLAIVLAPGIAAVPFLKAVGFGAGGIVASMPAPPFVLTIFPRFNL